jgi:hypothetical protein
MSVSGGQYGNLDNYKKTSLSGPDATRRFGSTGGAIDREARRLRRQGNTRGFMELSTEAAKARLVNAGMRSFETKRATEDVEDNMQQQTIADKNERLRRGNAANGEAGGGVVSDSTDKVSVATPDSGLASPADSGVADPNEANAGQVVGDSIVYTDPFNPSQKMTKSYSDLTQAEKDRVNKTRSLTQAPPPLTRQAAFGQRGKI